MERSEYLEPATLFLYIKVKEVCHPKARHIEVDPIKGKKLHFFVGLSLHHGPPATHGSELYIQLRRPPVDKSYNEQSAGSWGGLASVSEGSGKETEGGRRI